MDTSLKFAGRLPAGEEAPPPPLDDVKGQYTKLRPIVVSILSKEKIAASEDIEFEIPKKKKRKNITQDEVFLEEVDQEIADENEEVEIAQEMHEKAEENAEKAEEIADENEDVQIAQEMDERAEEIADEKKEVEIEDYIKTMGLPQRLVETLEKRGITQLFRIQVYIYIYIYICIMFLCFTPLPALEGHDIIARAKTGTGKTLEFGIPIIKGLNDIEQERGSLRRSRLPKALVLAPTRELAKQVQKEFKESAPYLNTVCIYGGVSYVTQESALSHGVDVVVGTPGIIIDLINNKHLKLEEVQYLVLDEADQMLAVGFEKDVEVILEKLPPTKQSMLFSATMPGWVKKLAKKHLDNPLTIDLVGDNEEKLAEGIKLYAIQTNATSKQSLLSDLVTVYAKGGKTIVFTQTKRDANEVSLILTNIASEALHGDISQHQRERTLNGFRQGKFTVLVATDVAASGLDIPNVDLIIHYELPNDPETFVHQSGITGRAGKQGTTILMFTSSQRRTIKSLERDVGCKFDFISPPSVQEVMESSAEQVVAALGGVHPESLEYFTPIAQKLMEQQGVNALAAALATLSGFSQPPSSRSLITHQQKEDTKEEQEIDPEVAATMGFGDYTIQSRQHTPPTPLSPPSSSSHFLPTPPTMASSSSSILGVPSIYQTHDQSRKPTSITTPPLSFRFSTVHNPFRPFSSASRLKHGASTSNSFVASAVFTPNSSVLSEEAFKGLGGFGNVSESEYEDSEEGVINEDELDMTKLGLPQRLVETLEKRGITQLFPIQRAVLVPALEGRDIIARAKTGTGKTLAFGIPIIKGLNDAEQERGSLKRSRLPKALVLAPTRELAKQVEKEFKESAPYLNTVCIYGGVSYVTQESALSRGVDVVVGTPGRIIDLINNNHLKLGEVQYLVLDEADQMLAVGFEEDVEVILEKLPPTRQSMLFSATMPGWVKKLARKHLDNPLTIDLVGDQEEKLAEGIKLYAIQTNGSSKRTILSDLVTVYAKGGKAIVFTRTKRDADEVSLILTNSIASEALHGDISQHQRERTLNGFRQGKFTVLVATDVAARGLDIPNVDLIIHYELPNDPETFVHRSGRTGRAGKLGTAVLMFTGSQRRTVKSLERDVGCKFEFISAPSIQEVLESSAEQVVTTLGGVHPESLEYFTPTAQRLMEQQGVNALAAALATLSGFSQPPSSRSLITHEQGLVTLQFMRDSAYARGYLSARSVTGFLSDVYSAAADEIGKIHVIADEKIQGAVFDLPEEIAKELLKKELPPGNTITKITKLPPLQDDGPPSDSYGRFSNNERRPQRGSRDRGGFRSSRDWLDGDDNDGFKRGGRSGRSENSWSKNSRSSGSDWLISDRRSSSRSPSSGGGGRDRFGGACFTCGRTGHRASECPSKKGY
ncbi:hypothetical protein BUALT_Bualt19G0080000 [Buddleja alternifolia]|uniref:RNA helicase n=1 Tax=Buddleja alternifolia TaxID=168488 RepID=A0AAV6W9L8_9LAMI|nr:hypothetical protein BUALT_Bualt19G0080000 [Buddleja alternifolia]